MAGWPLEIVVDADEGIVLRAPDAIDAEAMADAINRSLAELGLWMPWASAPARVDDQAIRLAVAREAMDAGGDAIYTVFEAGDVLGAVGVHARQGPGALEIGYWLRSDRTGRGIISRCVRALRDLALSRPGIDRVEIHCDEANARSAGVARRAGFTHVGTRDEERSAPGDTNRTMVWEFRRGDEPET